MIEWDLNNLKNKTQLIVDESNLELYVALQINFIINKIFKILFDSGIYLPEPQIEKESEGLAINVVWFNKRKLKTLSFTIREEHTTYIHEFILMSYLSDSNIIEIKAPTDKDILEKIKEFLE